jgi:hypothetical protein
MRYLLLFLGLAAPAAFAEPFVAVDPARAEPAPIVISADWEAITGPRVPANSPDAKLRDSVLFLQDAIRRMTGKTPAVASKSPDLSRGIVLTLATPELLADPAIAAALKNDGSDSYNDREAFYLRSETARLLVVANTLDGLAAAVPALLETVDYEVLAMGPNWVHVPKGRERLVFDVNLADRPSFYLRQLTPTTGQSYGVGTIDANAAKNPLTDPADEPVSLSWRRWSIALRNRGSSMDPFPGHALYRHHRPMLTEMRRAETTEGFLTAGTHLGPDTDRPAASPENEHHLWINTDPKGSPGFEKAFLSNGKEWTEQPPVGMAVNLDITSPLARQVVLDDLKKRAATHFAERPDDPLVYGTEAEDGAGYAHIGEWTRPANRDWYPTYLKWRGTTWPRPYALHGHFGIDQPTEKFDPATPADVVFAFNNWLLAEYDRWIDSLPEAERLTTTGRPKKELLKLSLYSYAYHDIPPRHNLDPRIRVMIAGYPKHRGYGEWKAFPKAQDVAAAFKVMLPREPSGVYRIISIAYYADFSQDGIPPTWSAAPERIVTDLRGTLDAGIRALTCETDFNFGKYGLAYYLMSRVLWDADLTPAQLDALRDRWLQRAYGSGWQAMKQYYDFMLIDHFPANAPAAWARAVRFIDQADTAIDPATEPDAQRRLDDLKQYWYYYYLVDSGKNKPDSPEMLEFAWKGQMSYANAMHMVVNRVWQSRRVADVVPEAIRQGPAHYTAAETAVWWRQILEHWPLVEVTQFTDATLANGRPAAAVDLNDLVRVTDFAALSAKERPFIYNSTQEPPVPFYTVAKAGETIGFQFSWPAKADGAPQFFGPREVPYGIDYWDSKERAWQSIIDVTLTTTASRVVEKTYDGNPRHAVTIQHLAARPGTYRIEVGRAGLACFLGGPGYDIATNTFTHRSPHTYFNRPRGHTQEPVHLYIPKGTRTLDLEVWDPHNKKQLYLYRGIGEKGLILSREVDISRRGTHRIALQPGEDGQLARIGGNGFAVPVLYSVPNLWAKSAAELLIPRAIAEADGLKVAE